MLVHVFQTDAQCFKVVRTWFLLLHLTHSLTYSLTHSLTHSRTHSLTLQHCRITACRWISCWLQWCVLSLIVMTSTIWQSTVSVLPLPLVLLCSCPGPHHPSPILPPSTLITKNQPQPPSPHHQPLWNQLTAPTSQPATAGTGIFRLMLTRGTRDCSCGSRSRSRSRVLHHQAAASPNPCSPLTASGFCLLASAHPPLSTQPQACHLQPVSCIPPQPLQLHPLPQVQ
jgi:hypothetical protein